MLNDTNAIIKHLNKGNLKEFEKLFRFYYPLLCRYSLSFTKDSVQAEEIVQELFCNLWENRRKLKIHTSFKAYLYRATYLNSLQYLRKKGIENHYQEFVKTNQNEQMTSGNNMEEIEIQSIIQKTLQTLPERCSQIFQLSRFEGLKYQEIADQLSISIKTVEANMGKALKAFRKNLKDYVKTIVL